jgi:TRAP-type C4-dicarboxylate transport system permease large subunit
MNASRTRRADRPADCAHDRFVSSIFSGTTRSGSAIIVVIMVEVGLIHPPVGMNLFVIQAQAPDVKITSIYRGIIPFLVAPLILIVLMFLFPGLALWLPKAFYG